MTGFNNRLMKIQLKRAYDPVAATDGVRILVDRIWPRGVTKASARIDTWLKEIAPSTQLRKWFGHDPKKWNEFRKRYRSELKEKSDAIAFIRRQARERTVTLVYSARDREHNQAVVLKEVLEGKR